MNFSPFNVSSICLCPFLLSVKETIEKHYDEIAAVISEPVMCNTGCILPEPGYFEKMRELCMKYDIILIIDKVITGFRVSLAGAQGYYGIDPDLSIFAKGMGVGIALAATSATMDLLNQPGIYDDFYKKSKRLMNGIGELWEKSKIDAYVTGLGPLFQVWFSKHPIKNYRDAKKYADAYIFSL